MGLTLAPRLDNSTRAIPDDEINSYIATRWG